MSVLGGASMLAWLALQRVPFGKHARDELTELRHGDQRISGGTQSSRSVIAARFDLQYRQVMKGLRKL